MGKRELLLIVGFVIAGAVLYQATAPPSTPPTAGGWSVGGLLDEIRREMAGNRATAEFTRTSTHPIDEEVTELRVLGVTELQIIGETRDDVQAEMGVHSMAYNEAEAKRFGEATRLETDRPGGMLVLKATYPQGRQSGRQRTSLTLRVPARLRVRVEGGSKLAVTNVEAVELLNVRGETSVKGTVGRVAITHRGGPVAIDGAGSVKFTGRGSDVTIGGVRGDLSLAMEGGGKLRASAPAGAIDLESRNAEITLDGLTSSPGPVRVNAVGGSVALDGVSADTRVDGRNSRISIAMARPAPVVVYSEGEDVVLTPPRLGYRLDAIAVDGHIAPDTILTDLGLEHATADEDREERASGEVNGGGPEITVRTRRSDVVLRVPDP